MANLENYNEFNVLNFFDISISHVNNKKIDVFKKIKSLHNNIQDIENDNDTLKNKLKNNIREIYHSMENIVVNLTDKEEKDKKDKNEKNIINDKTSSESDEGYNLEKQIKIGKKKTEINEKKNDITINIIKLHKENNLNKYVNIYITFRNQVIPNLIYDLYNKNKVIRFFYYIFCQRKKIKNYYYKNQWLNFEIAKENPCDIKWENCYISSWKKFWRRFLIVFVTLVFILGIWFINIYLTVVDESSLIIKTIIPQIVNTVSSLILNKFTNFEKYNSKTKEITSDISKYYWLNLLINISIFFSNKNYLIFSYIDIENYFYNYNALIYNMIWSIITSQLSIIFFYVFNLLKRFSDSKYNNGRTTEIKNKVKYENTYIGPEFPFAERYAKILVNLSLCLLYCSNCPIIFVFFILFLLVTFLVDKYLIIYYYKKPPFFGSFLSKVILNYVSWGVFLFMYGLLYNHSNPYLFNNLLFGEELKEKPKNSETDIMFIIYHIYYIMNPFTFFYLIFHEFLISEAHTPSHSVFYYNFKPVFIIHFFIFLIFFINPVSLIKGLFSPEIKFLSFLNTAPVEIGAIYSLEELKKYYEIKKLELFNLIIDCNNNDKDLKNYSHLINNYMLVMKYLKKNIAKKEKKKDNLVDTNKNKNEDEYSPLIYEDFTQNNQNIHLTGDISYNQSFIPKYEIYYNYSLMKNL